MSLWVLLLFISVLSGYKPRIQITGGFRFQCYLWWMCSVTSEFRLYKHPPWIKFRYFASQRDSFWFDSQQEPFCVDLTAFSLCFCGLFLCFQVSPNSLNTLVILFYQPHVSEYVRLWSGDGLTTHSTGDFTLLSHRSLWSMWRKVSAIKEFQQEWKERCRNQWDPQCCMI